MKLRLPLLALLAACVCLPAWASQPAGDVATASNLQRDGRLAMHKGEPVLIVFTSPYCRYCERVIHYYLVPMQRNPDSAGPVLIRQLDLTSNRKLVDFSGHVTTERAFAKKLKVDFAPTVMVFTPDGKPAAHPLVGLGPEDYYGGFLDQAVETAHAKMHGANPEAVTGT